MIKETLYATSESVITYHAPERGSEILIITFDPQGCDISERGFGTDFILKQGFEHIFVSHRFMSHYQGLSLDEFFEAVKHKIIGKKVFTYGASLGGYCAIYYAGVINAKAISIAPRNSAHPSIMGIDQYFQQTFGHIVFRHSLWLSAPLSEHDPLVIYDPKQKIDKFFLNDYIVKSYPDTVTIEAPYAGHQVAEALLEVGKLKEFFASSINGNHFSIELNEKNSSYYNLEIAEDLINHGDFTQAIKHLIIAQRMRPTNDNLTRIVSIAGKSGSHLENDRDLLSELIKLVARSEFFSRSFYLNRYQDIAKDDYYRDNPETHYLLFGGFEGRNPSEAFDTNFYRNAYPDATNAGYNPLVHFLLYGRKEGRHPLIPGK